MQAAPADTSELTRIDSPSESSVCEVLNARLMNGEIYTGLAAMLVGTRAVAAKYSAQCLSLPESD